MDELQVHGDSGGDDAADQRHVRRDELLAEGVGAVDQRAALGDGLDRATARDARDRYAVAAGERGRTPLEHAVDGLAVVEADLEAATAAGDDETFVADARARRGHRPSTFAAQMTSLSVTPPALCVDHVTVQRS